MPPSRSMVILFDISVKHLAFTPLLCFESAHVNMLLLLTLMTWTRQSFGPNIQREVRYQHLKLQHMQFQCSAEICGSSEAKLHGSTYCHADMNAKEGMIACRSQRSSGRRTSRSALHWSTGKAFPNFMPGKPMSCHFYSSEK